MTDESSAPFQMSLSRLPRWIEVALWFPHLNISMACPPLISSTRQERLTSCSLEVQRCSSVEALYVDCSCLDNSTATTTYSISSGCMLEDCSSGLFVLCFAPCRFPWYRSILELTCSKWDPTGGADDDGLATFFVHGAFRACGH